MKKGIASLCLLTLGSMGAFANTMTSTSQYKSVIHKGVKVSLDISSTNLTTTSTQKNEYGVDGEKTSGVIYNANTLTIGYQNITPSKWGYSALLARTQLKNAEIDYDFYLDMIEGNATYGLSEKWYMAFGGNVSRYTSNKAELNGQLFDKIGAGLGTQFAFGFQPNKYLGLEAKLMLTSHRAEFEYTDGVSGELQIFSSALRLGVSATF